MFVRNCDIIIHLNVGEAAGMYPSAYAMSFVDNHDNQRGHGAGGNDNKSLLSKSNTFYIHIFLDRGQYNFTS